jgi:casein kinase I family protein HRR25
MKDNKNLDDSFLKENEYIFKKYKPIKKIGKGTFGNIYSTIRLKDKNVFAIKTEKINANYKTLKSEAIYLFTLQGFGIPKYITYGHTKKYNILIETLLDKSLFFIYIKRRILCDITDACFIGMQLLDRLEWIHSKDIIYRDVKPENFLIGINDPNVIYVVDFGLCKKYRSSKTGKHILPKYTKKFNGTLRYASFNVVKGKESSRRDDLISLGYMLIYLIKRDLPWEADFKNLNKERYFNLLLSKDNDGFGRLFKNIPPEIIEFVKYSKNLKFEQDPDYSYLRSLFNKLFLSKNIDYKKLTFSFIHSKDKKLLGIPRNNSTRKESPQYRILKTIKKERSKRQITSSLSNLKNDSQSYSPISTNENKIILYSNNMNSSKFTHSEKVLRNGNNSNNYINVFIL